MLSPAAEMPFSSGEGEIHPFSMGLQEWAAFYFSPQPFHSDFIYFSVILPNK